MTQSDALQQAATRLNAAIDALDDCLDQLFADGDDGNPIASLREQVHFLTEERDRLLLELDAERSRGRRLEAANDEVSDRLEAVLLTLRDMVPAVPG
jgi:Domain of unknown function (DUF4164)